GTNSADFTVVSSTEITAEVASGASGSIEVATPGGKGSAEGFEFINAPTIDSFTPTAAVGDTVIITGSYFTNDVTIEIGGAVVTSFTVTSSGTIEAIVPSGTSDGSISVTTAGGTASAEGFTLTPAPSITSFTPTSAASGATVTITGTDFTGATAVTFGGTNAADFTVVSSTEITAEVASGASGSVEVTTPGGTASETEFTFIPAPTISSFTPTTAASGTTVTITGTDFTDATAVTFGGTNATDFTVESSTEITAEVDSGASGNVEVTTDAGTATLGGFTFENPQIAVLESDNNPITHNQSEPYDFGTALADETIEKQFTIENTGNADLIITNISSSDEEFEVSSVPDDINPGAFGQFTVQFDATDTGIYNSEFSINNNSNNSPEFIFTVTAELTGVNVIDNETESIVISNEDIDLGETLINVDMDKNFKIENRSSNSTIEILSITVDNPVFEIVKAPTSIAHSSSAEFTVRLIAEAVGKYQGTVTISTSLNEFSFQVVGEVLPESTTEIKVFNVVTPNGDGKHDFLKIENITEYPNNIVSIFNRWGDKVFEIKNYDNSRRIFKGISDKGKELLTGNYYYVIDKGNREKRISGFLIIKR
ncbi:MAG: IPT/TIG domain-containing protein, partial [Bacteroidota bacterium]